MHLLRNYGILSFEYNPIQTYQVFLLAPPPNPNKCTFTNV